MRTKRILTVILLFVLSFQLIAVSVHANDVMPCWENIFSVHITHGLDGDKAICFVSIDAYTGTNKIDNVDITLYQKIGNALIYITSWEDMSVTGDYFQFLEEADGVYAGNTYRLAVTADVHRNGYAERLDTYGDVVY